MRSFPDSTSWNVISPNLIFDAAVPFQYGKTNEEVKKGIAKLITEKWSNYYAVIQAEQSYTE